jgi:amino acid transporter
MSDVISPGTRIDASGTARLRPANVAIRSDVDRLQPKAVGLAGVLFLTMTGAAPITAMLLNVPVAVGNGNGIGAPAAYLVATIILLIFSVGYAAMARKVTAVGGFYSFISHGLGRELGMAMGFGSVVAYSVFEASLAGGFAYFMNLKLIELFHVNIAWPILAIAMVAGIAVISYLDVRLSSIILGVALVAEVLILLVFDAGTFAHAGSGANVQLAAINPVNAFQGFAAHDKLVAGAAGIGLFFAFWSWVGFEMAPNYAEESRDPKRIVPLSLYISVLVLGVFYTVTSWAALSGYPQVEDAIKQGQNNAAAFFFEPSTRLVGAWATAIMSYLILTSSFACGMAFHNTAARYLYSLGRERILPAALGRTHHKYKTPFIASFVQTGFAAAIVIAFAVLGGWNDPNAQAYTELYGLMALMGTILIVGAQAIVSIAIVVYFRREHPEDHHWWHTTLAPLIAFAAQAYVLWLCLSNMSFLGGGIPFANWLAPIDLLVLALGFAGALYIKSKDPARYEQIGRLIYEGVPDGMIEAPEEAQYRR